MYKSVADEWVRRLKSGDYVQGVNRLRYTSHDGTVKHCCLGVLSDMAVEKGIVELAVDHDRTKLLDDMHNDAKIDAYLDGPRGEEYYEDSMLPATVANWAGVEETNPYVTEEVDDVEEGFYLSELNDGGADFAEIADYIRNGMHIEDDSDNPIWG